MSAIPYRDKLFHVGVYFIASVLMLYGLGGPSTRTFRIGAVYTVVFCVVWGGVIEYLQDAMSRGRHFEVNDIIANIIGALMGVVMFRLLFKKRYYGS